MKTWDIAFMISSFFMAFVFYLQDKKGRGEKDVLGRRALKGLDSRRFGFLLILTHRFLLSNQRHNSQPPRPRIHAGLHKGLSGL